MSTVIGDGVKERVRQVKRALLDEIYETDYYKELHVRATKNNQHFDFVIGLGTAATGGSGLGILADPQFAWLCGFLTTASVVTSIYKNSYKLNEKMNFAVDASSYHRVLANDLRSLVDDVNVKRQWDQEFEDRFKEIRQKISQAPNDTWPELPIEQRRKIQQSIIKREEIDRWWTP